MAETELYQDDAVFRGNGLLQGGKTCGYITANLTIVMMVSALHSDLRGAAERWKAGGSSGVSHIAHAQAHQWAPMIRAGGANRDRVAHPSRRGPSTLS